MFLGVLAERGYDLGPRVVTCERSKNIAAVFLADELSVSHWSPHTCCDVPLVRDSVECGSVCELTASRAEVDQCLVWKPYLDLIEPSSSCQSLELDQACFGVCKLDIFEYLFGAPRPTEPQNPPKQQK